MQMVWTVGEAKDIIKIPLQESQGYLSYRGSVYGNDTYPPSVYEYFNATNSCVLPDLPVKQDSNSTADVTARRRRVF